MNLPNCEVHWPDGKKRERMNFHHYHNKDKVETDFEKPHNEFSVQQIDCLVFPRIFVVQIEKVKNVLHWNVQHDGKENSVLKFVKHEFMPSKQSATSSNKPQSQKPTELKHLLWECCSRPYKRKTNPTAQESKVKLIKSERLAKWKIMFVLTNSQVTRMWKRSEIFGLRSI